MNYPGIGSLVATTLSEWRKDKAEHLAAALAFYSVFSLAPALIIGIAVAGFVFGQEAAQGETVAQIRGVAGDAAAEMILVLVGGPQRLTSRITATVIGIAMLLLGATAMFAELQESLNTIWKAPPKPGRGVMGVVKDRILSFLMVLGIGLFLLASLSISTVLTVLTKLLGHPPPLPGYLSPLFHFATALVATTLLLAVMYKVLPDVKILWSDVWLGAAVTALLFTIGKSLIGSYLGNLMLGSVYDKASSLLVFLLWIFYSAQILFLGAEFTRAYAEKYGSRIPPPSSAVQATPAGAAETGMHPEFPA